VIWQGHSQYSVAPSLPAYGTMGLRHRTPRNVRLMELSRRFGLAQGSQAPPLSLPVPWSLFLALTACSLRCSDSVRLQSYLYVPARHPACLFMTLSGPSATTPTTDAPCVVVLLDGFERNRCRRLHVEAIPFWTSWYPPGLGTASLCRGADY